MLRLIMKLIVFCAAGLISTLELPSDARAQGRTATIVFSTNLTTLDPHKSATVSTDLSVSSQLYSALVLRGPDLKLKGDLATSWKAVDDSTWRFELRPNVAFPNGEKLDAAAVKWNFERVLDPKVNARIKSWFTAIKEVKVISPTEVEIVTSAPFPALVDQLSMFFLLPPQWSQQNNPATAAMGSGPYELKEFRSGERVVLAARRDYYGAKPAFDNVVYRVVLEEASRIAALLAGEVDLIDAIPPSEIKRINASGRAVAGALPGIRSMFFKYNNYKLPFKDNRNLRLALNHAVDRQGIIDSLWSGLGSVSNCQVLSNAYFGYNPALKPYPYDPGKAKQLLAAAGFPNGLDLELEVPVARYLQSGEISQIVTAQLGEIGVRVKIIELEFGRFMDKFINGQNLGQMGYLGMSWPTLDADGLLSLFEPGNPYSYYENQDFKRLVIESRSTTNPEKRKDLYRQATEVMCSDPPALFMFNQPATYGYSNKVEWQKRGDDWMRATDLTAR